MKKSLFQCQKKFLKKKKYFTQHDVENQESKEENEQLRKNNAAKDTKIKELIKKLKEIKSPKEDINTTYYPNWLDKNKFKKMLAIIDSNKFNYNNKIGEFKYIDIKDLVDNIRNTTISQIHAKKI